MEYALLAVSAVLAAIVALQHAHVQRLLERRDVREREERAMLLQRIQDPAQASIDHSVRQQEPVAFYPSGDDGETNELLGLVVTEADLAR